MISVVLHSWFHSACVCADTIVTDFHKQCSCLTVNCIFMISSARVLLALSAIFEFPEIMFCWTVLAWHAFDVQLCVS